MTLCLASHYTNAYACTSVCSNVWTEGRIFANAMGQPLAATTSFPLQSRWSGSIRTHARTDDDSSSDGGWVCASNSEVSGGDGGVVGAIDYVNSAGEVIWYQMILGGTDRNCGGGKTPWNMWLTTCEEDMERLWI